LVSFLYFIDSSKPLREGGRKGGREGGREGERKKKQRYE